jgi:hypothetical protein
MTLSIAVATKRAGISLTLRSKAHDLIEVRPTGAWLERAWAEDVVVLDLDMADKTRSAIEELRAQHEGRPIVVVAGEGDEWNDLKIAFPDLLVVPLPVTAATLLDTVDRAAALAAARLVSATKDPAVSTEVHADEATVADSPTIVTAAREPHPEPAAAPGLKATPTKHKAPTRRITPAAAAGSEDRDVLTIPEPASSRVVHYVELLLRDVNVLPRLARTAEVVRKDATAAVPAEASVVLVPDGEVWRVEAGHNLRPLEERLQIDPTHWLVAEVAMQRRGLMIRNTDIARNRLAGAPLASWANWLAMPVGDTDVIVVLAREDRPFAKADMARATKAIAHLTADVRHAVAVRALARALADFRDLVD